MTRVKEYAVLGSAVTALVVLSASADGYLLELVATALLLGLLAASADFGMGYCGILNLGPALSFGLGAYGVALSVSHGLGFIPGVLVGVSTAVGLACSTGWVAFRLDTSVLSFALIGLVLSLTAEQAAIGSYSFLGGSNGISGIAQPSFEPLAYSHVVCVAVVLVFAVLWFLSRSRMGLVMKSVRDDPIRAREEGYSLFHVRLFALAVTAVGSSIAGAFFVPLAGIAHPGLFSVLPNMLVLVWIAIGGAGTIWGPFLLAFTLKLVQSELGSQFENVYLLVLGLVFVATVVLRPSGLFGTASPR